MLKIFFFFALTNTCFAAGSTGYGKIEEVYVNSNWTMVIVPDIKNNPTVSGNPDACAKSDYYAIMPEDKNYSTLHSTLLAAQMAGKSVRFYVSGCSGQNGNYPHIVSVWVK